MNDNDALCKPDSPWWAKLLDRFGVSTALLFVLLYCLGQGAVWTRDNLVGPAVSAHLDQLAATKRALEAQTETLSAIKKAHLQEIEISSNVLDVVRANQSIMSDTNQRLKQLLNKE